jgi:hypothetical protein
MVDVARDARWGELWKAQVRMLLGSEIAVQESRFQGTDLAHKYYFGLCQTFCRVALQNQEGL